MKRPTDTKPALWGAASGPFTLAIIGLSWGRLGHGDGEHRSEQPLAAVTRAAQPTQAPIRRAGAAKPPQFVDTEATWWSV
jgi:hypothetical protein